ncbi:glycosyltransferase [Micromonospora haikouensis]|uniref:glycosyltransferase n=1 Tax=Micromonospora haikouensis TaxID=686309 RepID=UPI00369562AE
MHIIECHFECTGFDDSLVQAGTSVYLWNLVRQFRDRGHRVTALTAAHGLIPLLRRDHDVVETDWRSTGEITIPVDPDRWPGHPDGVTVDGSARAYRMTVEGIDVVLLSNEILDSHTDTLHPPAGAEGTDPTFLKPLVFQVLAARFLSGQETAQTVVHLHEPVLHHLLPAALSAYGFPVVSTVQTNLPVNTKVYAPQARALLRDLGADPTVVDGLADPPLDSPLHRAMRAFLPQTLLYRDQPQRPGHDYVSALALVARSAEAVDFLSEGQLEHALTQAETPFAQLFAELAVRRELWSRADRLTVGGCAIGDEWLDVARGDERRRRTLTALGLDPALPTVYHNGRYSVEHKGLRELFRGVRRLLDEGERFNLLLHCLAPHPPQDPDLAALAADHPGQVRIRTGPMPPAELMDWAASSDLCVFPAKFEMDTFLMAMGEAMASGAVPVATAQRGMRHFRHSFDLAAPTATGLALPRSFRVADPDLTDAVHDGLARMLALVRAGSPLVDTLRSRAVATAREFTWSRAADRFLAVFAACVAGTWPGGRSGPATLSPTPAPGDDGGTGTAVAGPDGVAVRWAHPEAVRVELVYPGDPVEVIALARQDDGSFAGTGPATAGPVALLVTCRDGRCVWAGAPVAATTG